jgi:hypothetical protein
LSIVLLFSFVVLLSFLLFPFLHLFFLATVLFREDFTAVFKEIQVLSVAKHLPTFRRDFVTLIFIVWTIQKNQLLGVILLRKWR